MKYFGCHEVKIDSKNRMSVPARFRCKIEAGANNYIRWHEDGFLEIGKLEDMTTLSDTFMQYAAPFYQRFPTIDKDGRIILPKQFREILGTEDRELKVFGRGKTFGICTESQWPTLEQKFIQKMKAPRSGQ